MWLHRVVVAVCMLSLAEASRGYSSLQCLGFWLQWLLLWSTGSRLTGFSSCSLQALECGLSIMAHGFSCSLSCRIFLNQEINPCPLDWQADSYPLYYQGGPMLHFLIWTLITHACWVCKHSSSCTFFYIHIVA